MAFYQRFQRFVFTQRNNTSRSFKYPTGNRERSHVHHNEWVIFILPSHESFRKKIVRAPFLSEPPQIYDDENLPTKRSKSWLDIFAEKVKGRGGGEGQRIK